MTYEGDWKSNIRLMERFFEKYRLQDYLDKNSKLNSDNYFKRLNGQLKNFLLWCDDEDFKCIFYKNSSIEMWRLIYIASSIGYYDLAFWLLNTYPNLYECIKIDNIVDSKISYRKWLSDFYNKQPDGIKKRRLAKKIMRNL